MAVVHRRDELAAFLRAHRAALHPEDVGLPRGRSRRTPGLRREEIAMLAGVSVTWYTWLEQGRPINASTDVLEALARALRLDDAERRHLLTLASRTGTAHEPIISDAPDALVRLITAMEPSPAYVLGPWFDFLAWNRAESLLYPPIDRLEPPQRNLLWVVFAEASARSLIAEWDAQARRLLAEFRALTVSLRDEPAVVSLVERLHEASPTFAGWWSEQDVAGFQTRLRRYHHPNAGELVFEYQQLTPSEWPGLRVAVQLPVPGDDSAQRLAAWRNIA